MSKDKRLREFSDKELFDELAERLKFYRKTIEDISDFVPDIYSTRVVCKEYIFSKPIEEFDDLTWQTKNFLRNARVAPRIRFFGDVLLLSYKKLRYIRGIGPKRADEIKKWVARHGFSLAKEE